MVDAVIMVMVSSRDRNSGSGRGSGSSSSGCSAYIPDLQLIQCTTTITDNGMGSMHCMRNLTQELELQL